MISLVHPLLSEAYPITQTYAEHLERKVELGLQFYNPGIDYGCPMGTPVYASAPGKVTRAGQDTTGYGTHVRVQHDGGYMTLYGHLQAVVVASGQPVSAGQMIGRSNNTGNSTGPHLHFELRQGNSPIDPLPYIGAALVQDPPAQPPMKAPAFPGPLPRAKVLVAYLNVRSGPGVGNPITGHLIQGNDPEVIRVKVDPDGNPWAQVGWQAWCALSWEDETLMEWV